MRNILRQYLRTSFTGVRNRAQVRIIRIDREQYHLRNEFGDRAGDLLAYQLGNVSAALNVLVLVVANMILDWIGE